MNRYKKPLIYLFLGIIIFLLSFNGVMQIEKLNFLIEPYFLLFISSLLLIFISIPWLIFLLLKDLINKIKSKD